MDVGRDFGPQPRPAQDGAQALDPLTRPIVELAEGHRRRPARAPEVTWPDQEAEDLRHAAQHRAGPQDPAQLLGGLDAVLERHDAGPGPEQRPHRAGSVGDLPRLHAQEHRIHRGEMAGVVARVHRTQREIAVDALNPEPSRAERLELRPASDPHHVLAGPGEPGPKVSARAARAEDRDAHPPSSPQLPTPSRAVPSMNAATSPFMRVSDGSFRYIMWPAS